MGFLINDNELVSAIKEVTELASASHLGRLFMMLLLSGSMGRPLSVWEQTWAYLFDDILYRIRHELQYPVEDIINTTYPNLVQNFRDPSFFQDKAILAPTVENVEEINNYIVDLLPERDIFFSR
ncbi:hypothetical protein Ahy_B10g101353 [Arachis hypogaea]|uniref:Uncharacterized protein n=1 Tax=Arachis hypogaea TaxID=3818 RepID=A0A444WZF8_ARAHY|nr:hypothetical protein Ahy_B10g101353 [Arachis hypogaea]